MANSVRLLYSPPANVFLRVARGAGSAALRAWPLGSPYSPLMVIAGWVVAHGPFRDRCPRAAPNPFLARYVGAVHDSMVRQSQRTGYRSCSTEAPGSLLYGKYLRWTLGVSSRIAVK